MWRFRRAVSPLGEEGLPAPVVRTRAAIYAAAVRRDYEGLRELIGPEFNYSFGNGNDPVAFWRELEASGRGDPLRIMAAVLRLPYTVVGSGAQTYYVWPFAYTRSPLVFTADERRMLRTVATAEEIASWQRNGAYLGYRLGIRADGTWMFFVAGD